MKFDPMTGEPIEQSTETPVNETPIEETPVSHIPVMTKKTFNAKPLIPIIAVAAVVVIVLVAVFSGIFTSKHNKILKAVVNTFSEQSKLSEACEALGLLATDSYTLSVIADVEGEEIEAALAVKGEKVQLSGIIDVSGAPEIEGVIGIDSKEVRAKIEGVDTVLVYNFTQDNDGDLIDLMEDEGVDVDAVNELLVNLTSEKNRNDVSAKAAKAMMAEFKEWEIEKVDKETFEIDGKDRKCEGYEFTVGDKEMQNLVGAVADIMKEEMDSDELDDLYDDLEDSFDDMPDVDVTVYIYKNKLAAVVLDVDGEDVEILFEGGDYRAQNIVVEADNDTILELAGSTDGSVEEYEVELAGRKAFTLEYDEKTGELVFEEKMSGSDITVEAILTGKANEFTFVLEDIDSDYGSIDCKVELHLEKGASIQNLKGEELDLGNADEDDFEDFAEDLFDVLY